MPGLNLEMVPVHSHCRWFVQRGSVLVLERGFRTKAEARNWIDAFGVELDWRVGFAFQLKGDDVLMEIVDREGEPATT